MEGAIEITPSMASPLEVMEKSSVKTASGPNMDCEEVIKTDGPNSKLLEALSSDCMALENIAQEFESRDEQATSKPEIIDLDGRNIRNDGIETVLHILDQNISSAGANNNGGHTLASHANKSHRHKIQKAVAIISSWTIGGAIDEFLRVHNCEPLLESDDESDNESCYSRGAESQAGNIQDPTEGRDEHEDAGNQVDSDEQDTKIKSLQEELEVSRQKIASLEGQINAHVPSPTQITHLVNQRRELEEIATGKRILEAQLASTHQQLVEAKQDATNATAKVELLQEQNKQLEDELFELKQRNDNDPSQILSGLNSTSTETFHKDPPSFHRNAQSNTDSSTIRQLRLDLNEAHSVLKRLQKERAREKKHYHRLLDGANSSKVDLESRLRTEMDNNLETRRKCYVLEQKMSAKMKLVIDLESELSSVVDELTAKGRENESLMHQVDHLKKLLGDENQQSVEIDCLQDINESLNDELTKSLEENKRLREQLRRIKKVSTHKSFQMRNTAARGAVNEVRDDEVSNCTSTVADVVNKDVFAKALDYLNEVESEGKLPTSVSYKAKHGREQITMSRGDCSGEETQSSQWTCQADPAPADDEMDILQESRKRFESMRSEFYGN
ncbi:hypothetical protein ACHAXN_007087 [Cyclotella atomus]